MCGVLSFCNVMKFVIQELKNYQTELNEMKTSFKTVSDELKSVKVEV